jgi:hypothetical protein
LDDTLECLLSDAIYTLLGDITPHPSKFLSGVTDVILPELHPCLLSAVPGAVTAYEEVLLKLEALRAAVTPDPMLDQIGDVGGRNPILILR